MIANVSSFLSPASAYIACDYHHFHLCSKLLAARSLPPVAVGGTPLLAPGASPSCLDNSSAVLRSASWNMMSIPNKNCVLAWRCFALCRSLTRLFVHAEHRFTYLWKTSFRAGLCHISELLLWIHRKYFLQVAAFHSTPHHLQPPISSARLYYSN